MKIDAIISEKLVDLITKLNEMPVKKENLVTIFQNTMGQYIAIFYY